MSTNTRISFFIGYCLFLFLCLLLYLKYDNKPKEIFIGYVVAKEYTPEHMSDTRPQVVNYAVLNPFFMHMNKPYKIPEKYMVYIANKKKIISRKVSYSEFISLNCGDKVSILK